jgi:hypothetical protein
MCSYPIRTLRKQSTLPVGEVPKPDNTNLKLHNGSCPSLTGPSRLRFFYVVHGFEAQALHGPSFSPLSRNRGPLPKCLPPNIGFWRLHVERASPGHPSNHHRPSKGFRKCTLSDAMEGKHICVPQALLPHAERFSQKGLSGHNL